MIHLDGRLPPQMCLECGYVIDAWSNAPETLRPNTPARNPKPGDEALCVNCGTIMLFDAHLKLRRPSKMEMRDPRLQHLIKIGKRSATMTHGLDLRGKKGSA